MKKVSLGLLALALTSTVASAAGQFTGFYTGASTGYSRTNFDQKAKISAFGLSASGKTHKGINGAIFDAFLGYGSTLGQSGFYIGGELGLGYDTAHFSSKNNVRGLTLRNKMDGSFFYNASARFGYVICNHTLLYTRIGYQAYNKKITQSVNGGDKQSYRRDGVIIGFGADHAVTKNLFIRGEYKYNAGHHYTRKGNIGGIVSVKHNVKTPSHTFLLGVGYKF